METSAYVPKLSAAIITLNEEKDLPRCLDSLKEVADEIVIVDSGSSDNTVGITKQFNARIYFREFDNYANQKNYAAEKSTGDWIFSIDADEEITPELSAEIRGAIKSNKFVAYSIPRKNIILGKFIKYTRWQPELDRHVWLWEKGYGKWKGNVHEEVVVNGKVGKLINPKIHYQYENVSLFMDMINRYSSLDATQRVKSGTTFPFLKFLFDPIYNFIVRYLYRLGFLDGWRGFFLSYLMAIYHLVLLIKVWEKMKIK